MIKYYTILLLFLISSLLFSQQDTLVSVSYSELGLFPRITTSGIYFNEEFNYTDSELIFRFNNNKFAAVNLSSKSVKGNFNFTESDNITRVTKRIKHAEIVDGNTFTSVVTSGKKSTINFSLFENRFTFALSSKSAEITFYYKKNIDYIDFIGITNGNYIFITEFITRTSPLDCVRKVLVYNNELKLINEIAIPIHKYFELADDLQLDENGNLLQIISDKSEIHLLSYGNPETTVVKTNNLEKLHYNYIIPRDEAEGVAATGGEKASSRRKALMLGEQYVYKQYQCTADNISYTNVVAPGGDIVKTPLWLVEGWNAGLPYKWGGFNSLSQFTAGLANGKYAGDIHTQGVSSAAVGVDCSGFVSRCWSLTSQYATSMMPAITSVYTYWSDLRPGDALLKQGHVRLFVGHMSNGEMRVVESTSRNWDVVYWSFAPSELLDYDPVQYDNMSLGMNDDEIKLKSVNFVREDSVAVKWVNQEPDLVDYRLYFSLDSNNWSYYQFETDTNFVVLPYTEDYGYFRLTSNNPIYQEYESFYSNIMACSKGTGQTEMVYLVDGFNRNDNSASFQGTGHNFIWRYAEYLLDKGIPFCSYHADELSNTDLYPNQIYWIVGDESTTNESLNNSEQTYLKNYLEQGGKLFICGSEIGWDLSERGTQSDKEFYTNYLKANYVADDANSIECYGVGSNFADIDIHFGQFYLEDYPDVISPANGAYQCLMYKNNKGAGVVYDGAFGGSQTIGKVVYLAFPLETAASDEHFNSVLESIYDVFENGLTDVSDELIPNEFIIYNNYPNPFNPSTTFKFSLDKRSVVGLSVYNLLGENVADIYNGSLEAGIHNFNFNASNLASGIYLAKFLINDKLFTQKISLIK